MNSIMQQIYMVPTFRYAILQSDDHKELIEKQTQRKSLYSWQKTAEQIQGIVQSI